MAVVKRPKFGNAKAWRGVALFNLILMVISWPVAVLWHGLPVLWQAYPGEVRRQAKTLWTGKPGPWDGAVW